MRTPVYFIEIEDAKDSDAFIARVRFLGEVIWSPSELFPSFYVAERAAIDAIEVHAAHRAEVAAG